MDLDILKREGKYLEIAGKQHSSREKLVHTVYVLRSTASSKLYIGYSSKIENRLRVHQEGRGYWTKGKGPWELIFQERFDDKSRALSREKYLKSGWGRSWLRKQMGNG